MSGEGTGDARHRLTDDVSRRRDVDAHVPGAALTERHSVRDRHASTLQQGGGGPVAEAQGAEVQPREVGGLGQEELRLRQVLVDERPQQMTVVVELADELANPLTPVPVRSGLGDDAEVARTEGDEGVSRATSLRASTPGMTRAALRPARFQALDADVTVMPLPLPGTER